MKTELQTITPAVAKQLLERNTDNRPMRATHVETLRLSFIRGEYRTTHQGIAFDMTGRLIDGQHRLSAISGCPAGMSFPIFVTTGADPEVYKLTDTGLRRSASDLLAISQGLAAVCRYLAIIHNGHNTGVTADYLAPFVKRVTPFYEDLVFFCPSAQKTWSSACIRSAAIVRMLEGEDRDYIKIVYHALVHAEFEAMPPVAQCLFRQHLDGKANLRSYDMFARALKVFDRGFSHLSKIQINDSSSAVASVRDVLAREIFGAGQKKAPGGAGAKVSKPVGNSTRVRSS
jgi:hypothetical protein